MPFKISWVPKDLRRLSMRIVAKLPSRQAADQPLAHQFVKRFYHQ
jgi:hypothetical protein